MGLNYVPGVTAATHMVLITSRIRDPMVQEDAMIQKDTVLRWEGVDPRGHWNRPLEWPVPGDGKLG